MFRMKLVLGPEFPAAPPKGEVTEGFIPYIVLSTAMFPERQYGTAVRRPRSTASASPLLSPWQLQF